MKKAILNILDKIATPFAIAFVLINLLLIAVFGKNELPALYGEEDDWQ